MRIPSAGSGGGMGNGDAQDGAAAELAVHEAELNADSWTTAPERKLVLMEAGGASCFRTAEWNHQRQGRDALAADGAAGGGGPPAAGGAGVAPDAAGGGASTRSRTARS
jgi:hypothetical protein